MRRLKARNLNELIGDEIANKVYRHEDVNSGYDLYLIRTLDNRYMIIGVGRFGKVEEQHHHGSDYEEASYNFDELSKRR
jgi:hypothetical protein